MKRSIENLILLCIHLTQIIRCVNYFSVLMNTPDYKALQIAPIPTYSNNSWLLIYTVSQSGWSQTSPTVTLPFISNGNNGISINFPITQAGKYTFSI